MTEGNSKEFEMAVGTSNVLDSTGMMEGANYYSPLETNESESPVHSNWSGGAKADMGQLCRSCANSSDYLIPIYEGEGLEHQLEFKIQKHLPIQVALSDTLPLQLCYQCASTLIAWDSMITSCIEADKKLRAMQEAAVQESKTSEMYEDSQSHVEEEDNNMVDDSDDEPLIKTKAASEKTRASPIKKKILSKAKSKAAPVKNKTATNSKDDEVDEEERQRSRGWRRSRDNSKCEIQNVEVLIALPVETAIKEELPETGTADEGTGKSDRVEDRDVIVDGEHEQDKKKKKKGRKPGRKIGCFTCDICEKMCTTKKNLERHLRTHEKRKSFICHLCGKDFRKNHALQRHVRTVHENRRDHICDLCGKAFLEKSVRDDHRRIHTGECPYVCQTCGKAFKTMASLCIHRKIHTDSFPHECTFCPKRFRFKQQLLGHMTMHTGEKKHFCDICGKGFGVRWDLTRHRPIHNTTKDFVCAFCGMMFTCKKYVQRHTKAHHKEALTETRRGETAVPATMTTSTSTTNLDLSMSVPVPVPVSNLIMPS